MRERSSEVVKSIVLSILVILSIYLYYKVYFGYSLEEVIIRGDYQRLQSDQELLKKAREIFVSPKEMYLNISKNVAIRILSNRAQYSKVVSKFTEGIEKSFVKKEFEIEFENISADFFKERRLLILDYGYPINFSTFVYELARRSVTGIPNTFVFDRIFIQEDTTKTIFYFFNSQNQTSAVIKLSKLGFTSIEDELKKDLKLIYSWSDSLGFTEIANKDVLIPVEFSDFQVSEIKTKESSYKKEKVISRLFPDTILTRKNILKNGDVVITDERRLLEIKSDNSFVFEYSDNFGERVESISDALMYYLKTFYTGEDLRLCKVDIQKDGDFSVSLVTRVNGIDFTVMDDELCSRIEVKSGRLKRISGYLFDIIKMRTSQIRVDGILAIDTIKEKKGDIFIEQIDLQYVMGGESSYPYWKIKTKDGIVYVETIK